MGNSKVLMLIPAYRDVELSNTIKSALRNAEDPDNLYFGILNQYGPETRNILNLFRGGGKRFKIIEVAWQEAQGEGWARHLLEELYRDEEYVFQTDAHMKFGKSWDKIAKENLKACDDEKAILSSYPVKFEYGQNNEIIIEDGSRTRVELRPGKGRYNFESSIINVPEEEKQMKKVLYATGGLEFYRGEMLNEVRWIKDIVFTGSEMVRSAVLYTHGYNIYAPVGLPVYHHYGRQGMHKFWEDVADIPELKTAYGKSLRGSEEIVEEVMSGKIDKVRQYFGKERALIDFLKKYQKDKATTN